MYKKNQAAKTSLNTKKATEGETIEKKIQRIVNNSEPITDGAPIIFTERKDGILPEHNIRTDRWDIALEATDVITKTHVAAREKRANPGGAESDAGTGTEAGSTHAKV